MRRSVITLVACGALFSGCSGSNAAGGPRGWNQTAEHVWSNPHAKSDTFTIESRPYNGTLADLASLTTMNVVLRGPAKDRPKLVNAVPFTRCPAVAGLQTYKLSDRLEEVAFAVEGSQRIQASYIRLAKEPDDPAAIDAMAANVCALP